MPRRRGAVFLGAIAAAGIGLAAPAGAAATTFCVPNSVFAGCPGGSTPQMSLETALGANASDGVPDTVYIQPGYTHTDTNSLQTSGTDALTIDGIDGTPTLTSSSGSNIYVVDLSTGGARNVTLKNVRIEVPASFPDNAGTGAALQMQNDTLQNVDFVSKNPGSGGADSIIGGGTFENVTFKGESGGYFYDAIRGSGSTTGTVTVDGADIDGTTIGITAVGANPTFNIDRARIRLSATTGQSAIDLNSGTMNVTNSILETPKGIGLAAVTNAGSAADATINADGVTLYDTDPTANTALNAMNIGGTNDARIDLASSIAYGYGAGWNVSDISGGTAAIAIDSSNMPATGASNVGGQPTITSGISADPLFVNAAARNFALQTGSPSIDLGDAASPLTTDFAGDPRPIDGDGNGTARIDQGALENQTVPDTTPPNTVIDSGPAQGATIAQNKATFAFRGTPAGDTAKIQCRLDAGAFADCTSPKTFSNLADGSHTVRFRAQDAAGNQDPTPAARTFTVDTTPPPDTTAPDTSITSGPGARAAKGKVRFSFAATEPGSSFECSLVKKGRPAAFTACSSPQRYVVKRRKKARRYIFSARATDQAGNSDATPAKAKFKVKRKR